MHICIVPDGNRRYAENNDLKKRKGHEKGFENAKDIVRDIDDGDFEVSEVSLWGLSRDNAEKREQSEVDYLNELFKEFRELEEEFNNRNVCFELIGDFDKVYEDTVEELKEMEESTSDNTGLKVNLLLGYDGKWDMIQAFEKLRVGTHPHKEVDEEDLERFLCIPEVDIVLGYGADREHLSHIANWQVGYSTLHFPHINFPEASVNELENAIEKHRERKKSRGK